MSKSRKAGSQEFRNKLEERKGTEWYDAAAKKGLHDARIDDNGGKKMYSGAEVRAEMRDGRDGKTTEEMTKYFSEGYANGTINLNGNAKDFLKDIHGATLQRNSKGDDKDTAKDPESAAVSSSAAEANKLKDSYIDTVRPGTSSKMDAAMKNTQQQNINQDNDQTSSITGDNNTVWQQQDNSIRQYGGDNRSFSYKSGNSGVDTPVSDATMSGYYDVDDSPAAQAKFLDLHSNLNNDAQKKYSGMGMKVAGMFKNYDARGYNPAQLESNLKKDEQRAYDRSTLAKLDAFGDRDAYRGTLSEFKFGAEPETVEYKIGDDDDD